MRYHLTLKLPDVRLADALFNEKRTGDRSVSTVKYDGSDTIYTISARDATALRAELNSIGKFLVVYEKLEALINDGFSTESTRESQGIRES